MRDRQYLFSDADWFSVERNQLQKMAEEIAAVNGDRLLNTAVDDLARYFESKFNVEVPALITTSRIFLSSAVFFKFSNFIILSQ